MIQKAAASAADAVCIDLEDSVTPDEKAASRANVSARCTRSTSAAASRDVPHQRA